MTKWAEERVASIPRMPNGQPIAYALLKPEDLPFTMQVLDEGTGELVHETTIHDAGGMAVPGFAPRRVCVMVTYHRSGAQVITTSSGLSVHQNESR